MRIRKFTVTCSTLVLSGLALFAPNSTVLADASMVAHMLSAQPVYDGSCWTRGGPTGGDGDANDINFPSNGVQLLSWLPVTQFGSFNTSASTVEGYVSGSGREYAIIGVSGGTGFVEVTDPGNATIVAFIPCAPATNSLWRDIRTYQNYCYTVSEGGGGIQVINMAGIDSGNVTLVGNVTTPGGTSSHTLYINQNSGFLYRCGGGSSLGIRVYSLANPASPSWVVTMLSSRYTHECQVVNYTTGPYADKEVAFCYSDATSGGGSAAVDILDVTNKAAITTYSTATYPSPAFSHQGWLSPDRNYIYINDELDEQNLGQPTLTRVINVSNLASPVFVTSFGNGLGAIDHNLYTKGNLIFQSNYRTGLRIWDTTLSQTAPTEVAYFDTYPPDNAAQFNGLWDNDPYLPSGIVLGSDIEKGLFVWSVGPMLLNFSYPSGHPALINASGGATVAVTIANMGGTLQAGTAMLNYSTGGAFTSVNLVQTRGNTFNAVFPAFPCGTKVTYYISAMTSTNITVRSPAGAPTDRYETTAASSVTVGFDDKMEANTGWVIGDPADNATTGIWTRVNPNGTSAQPEDDHTPDPAVNCWVTGQGPVGGGLGDNDVDGGTTTVTSPTMDASTGSQPYIEYYRWYSNNLGGAPSEDSMPVLISNNNGSTWTQLELVTENAGAWVGKSFRISDFVPPTNQIKLRFQARDLISGSVVEAGVDDVRIVLYNCTPIVPGDVTGNGVVNVDDLLAVINAWGPCPAPPVLCPADMAPPGGNGFVNVDDLLVVINNWS